MVRAVILASVLLGVIRVAAAQPPPIPIPVPMPAPVPVPSPIPAPTVEPPPAPAEKRVEDLVAELEALQAERGRMDVREKGLREELHRRLGALNEKVNKLGGPPAVVSDKAPAADRIGRVLIQGFPEKEFERVSGIVTKSGLRPGEVVTRAAIEDARGKLDKGGFKGAEVATIPSDQSPGVSDIMVKAYGGKSR